jgi:acetyltransferase-like isoleucine patch superfamily enzyme
MPPLARIVVPRAVAGDDRARLVEWCVVDRAAVAPGTAIAVLVTSKASFEVEAEASGFLRQLFPVGQILEAGDAFAEIWSDVPEDAAAASTGSPPAGGPLFTENARRLIEAHRVSVDRFRGRAVVRAEDVQAILGQAGDASADVRHYAGDELDPSADWDAVLHGEEFGRMRTMLTDLRRRMKARFDRHVSTSELLNDRWELARAHGFGEGSSVYDSCLILGSPQVGKHCWIGPNTVLDGFHAPLSIGDYSSVGTGSQIYTHNTIHQVLTGGRAETFCMVTSIGACVFISPLCVLSAGVQIGDRSFVATGSFVEGRFPACSYIGGNPARRLGRVEVDGHRVALIRE